MKLAILSILAGAAAALLAACTESGALDTGWTFYTPRQPAESMSNVAAIPADTRPAEGVTPQTVILVHGAWAGGWEWKPVGELMRAHGHRVYRPTLTGQGEREHLATTDIDLNTHIQDIVNVIQFSTGSGRGPRPRDIVLIGHSYGGMVVTGVADRIPERIKCLIYMDAHVPLDGESANMIRVAGARPVVDGYIPLNPAPRAGRQPPYIVKMPAKTFSQPISLKNQAAALQIPTAYILTVDRGRQPEQDDFYKSYARAQERGWAVSIMQGDHVVHINQTANLVERLERAMLDAKVAK